VAFNAAMGKIQPDRLEWFKENPTGLKVIWVTQNCNKCKANFRIIGRFHLFFRRISLQSQLKIENEQIPAKNFPRKKINSKKHLLLGENL
jgi:hypothetical protein